MDEQMSIFDFPEYLPDASFKVCECGYSGQMMFLEFGKEISVYCPVCHRYSTEDGRHRSARATREEAVADWNNNVRKK